MSGNGVPRRRVLGTVGVVCGAAALAACGGDPGPPAVPPGIKGKVIAKTADIPVGGGKVFDDWKLVVTQPSAGVFKAFTATCPHAGCAVGRIEERLIECPCHGSQFAIDSGECVSGPAKAPLVAFPLKVQGDGIVIG
ncbi:Rieske (2Fe-2S) protein [Spongiactinospora sp. TRM90649]|uniref:Rieske (2Fe-2S) protein n=1 Tax=Spongiactinospora sp. TRM90649 TaxID=3031114 RepID=UPI0023F95C22|nr:Rieske (2Fe-2S) protein [Spongiactinospora sp. TRM90649]MDF5759213.1 Rieske (2Fe-2S) protein [Spongiactinospora sp. TRM90649]